MLYKFSLVNIFQDAPPFTAKNMVPPELKSILINQDINYGPLNYLPDDNLSIGGFVTAHMSSDQHKSQGNGGLNVDYSFRLMQDTSATCGCKLQ